ncbi:MarR family transcriptional regulator [Phytomonospora endophytica]|uniref:DNA-binding MarR family transcriptional regulator n=1 Tax=Phytomonospora endophytica TaxID=714109 RepID=A0A841FQU6_9ACTN|nr:MarR family transcriptional regulator [Phytomonospora endophytica]MBB6038535.1 DNA-binding MarR family transcriptional regulator [Phytomonospora endophytica]GIG69325.1 hypothetical protein Pen01_56200 [Phytomonospora endophytica]
MTDPQPTPRHTLAAYLAAHPHATIADISAGVHLARSTVTKQLKAMEHDGLAERTRPGKPGAPDLWRLSSHDAPHTTAATPAAVGVTRKLAAGELHAMVAAYFTDHPEQAVTAGDIARVLGRSAGAVTNVIDKLIHAGQVRLHSQPPRRFIARPAHDDGEPTT